MRSKISDTTKPELSGWTFHNFENVTFKWVIRRADFWQCAWTFKAITWKGSVQGHYFYKVHCWTSERKEECLWFLNNFGCRQSVSCPILLFNSNFVNAEPLTKIAIKGKFWGRFLHLQWMKFPFLAPWNGNILRYLSEPNLRKKGRKVACWLCWIHVFYKRVIEPVVCRTGSRMWEPN